LPFFHVVHMLSLFDLLFFVFSISFHYSTYFSSAFSKSFHFSIYFFSIFSISFHNFCLYFPNHFTIQLIFFPYFPYHFTFQLAFFPCCPYLITIRLTFLLYFPNRFTIRIFLPYFPMFSSYQKQTLTVMISPLCTNWHDIAVILLNVALNTINLTLYLHIPTYLYIYIFIRIIDFCQFFLVIFLSWWVSNFHNQIYFT
jgi:hypothetical protein